MKLFNVLAGALSLALISLAAPASAQVTAESALEFAAAQNAQPVATSPACKGRRCRAVATQGRPLEIRTAHQLVSEAMRYVGTRNPMRFSGPGCKAFVNMVARRAGYAVNASMRAFDAAAMGIRISHPEPGAYRITKRRGGGHVDIVAEVHGRSVTTVNGNKGRNRVGLSHKPIAGAAYYRPIVAWAG